MKDNKPAPTIPDGYKQTEIGIIPEDWEVKKLAVTAEIATGNTPPTKDTSNYGDDFLFVSPIDLGQDKYVFDTEKKLSHKGFNISRRFPRGSILFTCIGSTIGKSAIAPIDLTSNQQINALFPNTKYSTDFVFYVLNLLAPKIKSSASEQAVPIINKTAFGETLIPFPPLPEQQAISKVLSEVDALISSLDQFIAKKRNIKQGAMQLLLTGKKRLASFSGDWETKTLGDIAPLQRGFDLPNKEIKLGIYPVVYSNGILNRHYTYKAKAPGVVTGRSGTIGKVIFVDEDYFPHNTSLWVTDFKHNSPKFIYYLYVSLKLERFGTGSGVPTLNRNDVHSFETSIPRTKEEQEAIAQILSDMDAEIEALGKKREKYKAIKRGMMQELLTGKTRLI